jgi:hypothetical protein
MVLAAAPTLHPDLEQVVRSAVGRADAQTAT